MGLNPVIAMFIGIIVMMALIISNKLHPFPSLIISAILIASTAMRMGTRHFTTALEKRMRNQSSFPCYNNVAFA